MNSTQKKKQEEIIERLKNPNRDLCVTERIIGCPSYFKYAQIICKQSTHTKTNHGAAIIRGGRIIGLGYNSIKRRKNMEYNFTHAEMDAILNSNSENLRASKIFVFRQDKYGWIAYSKPCSKCTEILKKYGIKRAYYTINEKEYGVMIL